MIKPAKKRRGRKPKNKIISNESPIFENEKIDNILVTCIKKHKENIYVDELVKPHDILQDNYDKVDMPPLPKIKKCWNCSFGIEGDIVSYPTNYHDNMFYINGNFCSYECSARYIYETYSDREFWDKYHLLNFYTNMIRNTDTKIKIPPSRLRLIEYGGDLTKQEYLDTKNVSYDNYIPPIIYVNNSIYNKCSNYNKENEFKFFRKNKKKKEFIKNLTLESTDVEPNI